MVPMGGRADWRGLPLWFNEEIGDNEEVITESRPTLKGPGYASKDP